MRLIPYLLAFAIGFFVGMLLFRRKEERIATSQWEAKYRDLLDRYRDLTRKLQGDDGAPREPHMLASRYRQTLWDVRGVLLNAQGVSPEKARSAVAEIDEALRE